MGYNGKTADNKTSQLEGVAWTPVAPTLKATLSGSSQYDAKGAGMSRTASPNAQTEKLFEKHSEANTK